MIWNEPTTFLLTTVAIGLTSLIIEKIAEEKDSPLFETIHRFKSLYIRYVVPTSVVGYGVYVFLRLVKILL